MRRAGCDIDKCHGTDQQTREVNKVLRVTFDLTHQLITAAGFRRFNGWKSGQRRFLCQPGHNQFGTQTIN